MAAPECASAPPKSSAASPAASSRAPSLQPGARRVMGRELAGRDRRAAGRRVVERDPQRGLDPLARQRARTQQSRPPAEAGDDRQFDAAARRAAVEDPVDPAVEVGGDMGGGGRADAAGAVGRGRGERDARRRDQRLRDRVIGRAQRQRLEPGAREQTDLAARRDRRDDRQRPRPERLGEPAGEIVECASRAAARRAGDMGDQRIERRPALRGVDRRDGAIVGRVAGEPVNRFGRHRDQPAGA